jgi:hypothetical protein
MESGIGFVDCFSHILTFRKPTQNCRLKTIISERAHPITYLLQKELMAIHGAAATALTFHVAIEANGDHAALYAWSSKNSWMDHF